MEAGKRLGIADLARIVALDEFETFARLAMEPGAFDYVAGGAGDELSLADNVAAWRRYQLRPRVLVDVADHRSVHHPPRGCRGDPRGGRADGRPRSGARRR